MVLLAQIIQIGNIHGWWYRANKWYLWSLWLHPGHWTFVGNPTWEILAHLKMFSQNDWGRSKLQAGKYWQLGLSPWLHEVVHWGWTGGQAGQQALIHLVPWRWSWQRSWPLAAGWVAWAIGLPPNGSKWAMTTHSGWGPSMDHLCALPWEAAHLAGNHGWWPSEKLWCGWWTSWGNLSMDMNKWKQWKHGMPANSLWSWRLTKKHKPYSCHGNQRTLRTCHGCHGTIGLLDEVLIGHQLLRPLGRVWWDLYGHGFSKELPFHTNGHHLLAFVPHVQPWKHLVGWRKTWLGVTTEW